jgi:hypothetical protein
MGGLSVAIGRRRLGRGRAWVRSTAANDTATTFNATTDNAPYPIQNSIFASVDSRQGLLGMLDGE